MHLKSIIGAIAGLAAASAMLPAHASYTNYGGSFADFSLNNTAWLPNGGVRLSSSAAQPGSATWSVMGAGLVDASGNDDHGGNATTLLSALYSGGSLTPLQAIQAALDTWASVSGFTNLGQVADGGGNFGAAGAAGAAGNIRIGAIFIDGASGNNVLAHAFSPCNGTACGGSGNIGGDTHFDNSNTWSDGGSGNTIDFYSVALHELGHALGLGHSTVAGSVMEATYTGQRRTLSADDIAGIQALYGVSAVPEPASYLMFMVGALGMAGYGRRRMAAARAGQPA